LAPTSADARASHAAAEPGRGGWAKSLSARLRACFARKGTPARGAPEEVRAVEAVLAELRPALVADGGGIELLAVEDGWVRVRLRGACTSCPAQASTLRGALEPRLRERLPFVRGLRAD